jgi:hypothetical protein
MPTQGFRQLAGEGGGGGAGEEAGGAGKAGEGAQRAGPAGQGGMEALQPERQGEPRGKEATAP